MIGKIKLKFENGPYKGEKIKIVDDVTVIGSSDDESNMVLHHSSLSPAHCQIARMGTFVHIRDLGSKNGTCVNGKKIEETQIKNNDRLRLGELEFTVEIKQMADGNDIPEAQPDPEPEIEDGERIQQFSRLLYGNISAYSALAENGPFRGHAEKVAHIAQKIARYVKRSDEVKKTIFYAAQMMNTGMAVVHDETRVKKSPLSDAEIVQIRRHPAASAEIFYAIRKDKEIYDIIRAHHERWDGEGYPDRLAGKDIPLGARIVAIADTFVALCFPRPYRPQPCDWNLAINIIRDNAGVQFDPNVSEAFLALAKRGKIKFKSPVADSVTEILQKNRV